ncbi:hypothetical protein NC653_014395 [Populus alba x Populus x berolinensis]|uniref:Secreted protein n=1 Tax=Populus alba x Populus x berolinensis TaxID=444605 RepID=A0AAD6QXV5_9ROSI|nr:hypothetical protein NC653_014395 [Populus alba x Populus x berolinensis]
MLLFLLSVLSLLSQPSDSTTMLVDGFSRVERSKCLYRRLHHFQTQVSLQAVHFPEPKSLQPLQLHSSYASHQAPIPPPTRYLFSLSLNWNYNNVQNPMFLYMHIRLL